MTTRARRHQRLLELIRQRDVRSQDELRRLLAAEGLEATQATLSRDLRRLAVVKGPHGYVAPGSDVQTRTSTKNDSLRRALRQELLEAEAGAATIVLKTRPGHADALAIEIDSARLPGVLGTIAGDDTIFLAARSHRHAASVLKQLRELAALD